MICLRLSSIAFFLLVTGATAQADDGQMVALTGQTMGTTYSIKYLTQNPTTKNTVQKEIDRILEHVNDLASTYRTESEISRFNRHAKTDWFAVDPAMARWTARSLQVGKATNGAFDITVGMLVNLWGFGPKAVPRKLPSAAQITEYLKVSGPKALQVSSKPPGLKKSQPTVTIDLSGIAKGAGVDEVADFLIRNKIANFMVEIGGEIRTAGHKGANQAWALAIEKPDPRGRRIQRVINLRDGAMATSGDYRNYFEDGGKRYAHILDPRTGRPIEHRLASVTVIAKNCADADAFATAFMVLGYEKAAKVAASEGLEAFFIIRNKNGFDERMTKNFSKYLVN